MENANEEHSICPLDFIGENLVENGPLGNFYEFFGFDLFEKKFQRIPHDFPFVKSCKLVSTCFLSSIIFAIWHP